MEKLNIYSTRHTMYLAEKVVSEINKLRNIDTEFSDFDDTVIGKCKIEEFANKEITCQYLESIRDKQIYIFGQTGTHEIMELLLMIDAAKRASVGKITVVIPCYGYARQDKKEGIRGPMGAKLVADMISCAGASSVITLDLHAESIQGFFDFSVTHVNGYSIFKDELKKIINNNPEEYVVCSPDAGGSVRANKFSKKLGLDGAVAINKERSKPGVISKMILMADVSGKHIILVDDLIDSGGTLCKAADYLIEEKNAKSVVAICTHPIMSNYAWGRIVNTKNLSKLYVSDTMQYVEDFEDISQIITPDDVLKITKISCSTILAKIIGRVAKGKSVDSVNT